MLTQTIQSFAVTLSSAGYGDYVIIDLTKVAIDAVVPENLPHGIAAMVGGEKTALEFHQDDDHDYAHKAYDEIVEACRDHQGRVRGTITLIENGDVEATAVGVSLG